MKTSKSKDSPSLIMPARRHFWNRHAWHDFLRLLVISQSFTTGQLYSMLPETSTGKSYLQYTHKNVFSIHDERSNNKERDAGLNRLWARFELTTLISAPQLNVSKQWLLLKTQTSKQTKIVKTKTQCSLFFLTPYYIRIFRAVSAFIV